MDPDAIKREERTPGRPGPHCGRAPEVLSELTERTCQGEPFIDIPQDHGEAAWVPYNGLGEALHLDAPLPWCQSEMGRNDADNAAVDRDIDIECTPRLTWGDVYVNASEGQDWQARG